MQRCQQDPEKAQQERKRNEEEKKTHAFKEHDGITALAF